MLVNAYSEQGRDFTQMLLPAEAFATGNWAEIYPESTKATSPVGWLVTVAPLYALLKPLLGATVAFSVSATLVAVALLVGGMRFAATALYPRMGAARAWGLSALVLILPTTVSAWHEYYHPQDVAAAGFTLFAIGFAAKKRWVVAALLFGGGTLVRQWVALIALAVSPLAKRKFLLFAAAGAAVAAAGIVPFMVFGNTGFGEVLNPSSAFFMVDQTLVGRVAVKLQVEAPIRYIPVLIAVGAAVYAWVKKLDGRQYLVPLALTVLIGRQLFELAPLTYYWVPVTALMLLLNARRSAVLAATLFSLAVWPIGMLRGTDTGNYWTSVLFLFAGLAAAVITWMLSDTSAPDPDPDENSADDPAGRDVRRPARWGTGAVAVVVAGSLLAVTAGTAVLANRLEAFPETREVPLAIGKEVTVGSPAITPGADGEFPTVVGQRASGITNSITPNGEPQLVAFWVHWCTECVEEAPDVVGWAERSGVKLSVVAGPIDENGGNLPQRIWLFSIPWDGPTIIDGPGNDVRSTVGLTVSPAYVVFDGDGKIVDAWEGGWDATRAATALGIPAAG